MAPHFLFMQDFTVVLAKTTNELSRRGRVCGRKDLANISVQVSDFAYDLLVIRLALTSVRHH